MSFNDKLFLAAVGDATRNSKPLGEIFCSCGRQSYLWWKGEKYVELTGKWKYRRSDEFDATGRRLEWGWYCGEVGHEQKTRGHGDGAT